MAVSSAASPAARGERAEHGLGPPERAVFDGQPVHGARGRQAVLAWHGRPPLRLRLRLPLPLLLPLLAAAVAAAAATAPANSQNKRPPGGLPASPRRRGNAA